MATMHFDPATLLADFPILAQEVHPGVSLRYLDNAATTHAPRQVLDSIRDTMERHYANVHRGIHALSEQSTELYENARGKLQAFLGAEHAEEIIFTRGTTESINLVARSWGDANLKPGDEILLTEMEHHANLVPWFQAAERTGATVRCAPITDDGQLDMEAFKSMLTTKTKVVGVVAISNVLGTINPLEEIIATAHAVGSVVIVDGAQQAPHQHVNLAELDTDFYAASGHKMLGPSGIGILYGKRELLQTMPPFLGGGSMIRRVTTEGFEPAELPTRFEAGTPPIVAAIALGVAIDYLKKIDLNAVEEHERTLTVAAQDRLQALGGVRILGPSPDKKVGIVSFVVDGVHAHDIAQRLDSHGIAVRAGHHCTMPLHKRLGVAASSRASFYIYNTQEDVDCLVSAVEDTQRFFRKRK
ncbi:MAG: cysteine desulfurase [Pirellulales bacterium]|nr:cysteine desulfurase [Pirellulales bacterium]